MTQEEFFSLKAWFEEYLNQFQNREGILPPMLELKRVHSVRVAENARFIAVALGFPKSEQRLSEAVGLVHDVGRFPQFAQFNSFRDGDTVDHGAEGRRVLETQVLSFLKDHEVRDQLLFAVEYHNRRRSDLPSGLTPSWDRLLRLVRDADKLDIMELVLQAVASDGFQALPGMLPHIRISREIRPDILGEAMQTRSVSIGNVSTLAEFLIMMATWCYDMNFFPTRHLTVQRDILPRIKRELPDTKAVGDLFASIAKALLKTTKRNKTPKGRSHE